MLENKFYAQCFFCASETLREPEKELGKEVNGYVDQSCFSISGPNDEASPSEDISNVAGCIDNVRDLLSINKHSGGSECF